MDAMLLTFVATLVLVERGGRVAEVVEWTSGDWLTLRNLVGAVAAKGEAAVRLNNGREEKYILA